jgi:hypothetical protein
VRGELGEVDGGEQGIGREVGGVVLLLGVAHGEARVGEDDLQGQVAAGVAPCLLHGSGEGAPVGLQARRRVVRAGGEADERAVELLAAVCPGELVLHPEDEVVPGGRGGRGGRVPEGHLDGVAGRRHVAGSGGGHGNTQKGKNFYVNEEQKKMYKKNA